MGFIRVHLGSRFTMNPTCHVFMWEKSCFCNIIRTIYRPSSHPFIFVSRQSIVRTFAIQYYFRTLHNKWEWTYTPKNTYYPQNQKTINTLIIWWLIKISEISYWQIGFIVNLDPCEPCATVKRCYNKRIWIQYHPPIIYPTKKSTIKRANKIIARGNKTIAEANEYPWSPPESVKVPVQRWFY